LRGIEVVLEALKYTSLICRWQRQAVRTPPRRPLTLGEGYPPAGEHPHEGASRGRVREEVLRQPIGWQTEVSQRVRNKRRGERLVRLPLAQRAVPPRGSDAHAGGCRLSRVDHDITYAGRRS
jgi:hypothetical protein